MPHEAANPQLTPERWQQIRGLLAELIEVQEQDRASFLSSNCGDDANLRMQLEDLLRMHEATEARGLDQAPVAEISAALADRLRQQDIGHRIGAYRVEAQIARGGMGTVYRAIRADDEYKKEVAIKVVDRGMLSRRSAELFRHERQILASLEHPNIARLLDGGTNEDGSPYLVMEYVEGETITRYCDSHQLSIEERLKLFQKICSAVHFAHQNLIIHRDIKPANILVSGAGEPKLLDFGIAKVVGADPGAETETRTFGGMTPAYASPEQLTGHAVTTATDVYSLGLVLYELLTGRYAYEQFSTPARRQKAILEDDPERPSQAVLRESADLEQPVTPGYIGSLRQLPVEKLSRRLAGDLESIVAKAIQKQPEQRYSSMAQFSEDIARHLRGETVIARQNTFIYRSIKFVRRHKLGIAAGALVLALLVTGMVVVVRAERKARAEQEIAERRFNDLRKLADSLMFEVHDAIKDLPGATPARKLVVSKALEYLDRLSKDASSDPTLQRELATAYQRVGEVQGGSIDANLGDYAGALASYQKALRIRELLAKADPQDLQLQQELAGSYLQMGTLVSIQKSVNILKPIAETHSDPAVLNRLAGAYFQLAAKQSDQGDMDSSLANHLQALSIRNSIQTSDPALIRAIQMRLPGDYGSIAQLLRIRREFDQALEYQRKAVTLTSQLSQAAPQNQTIKRYLGSAYFYLGRVFEDAGDRRSAVPAFEKGARILETIHHDDPLNEAVQQDLAFLDSHLGELEVEGGATRQGFEHLRSAVSSWDKEIATQPGNDDFEVSRAISYFEMGRAYAVLARRSPHSRTQIQLGREARLFLQQSDQMWRDLQSRHVVPIWEQNVPTATTKALAECDSRLIKLSKQSKWKDRLPG